ncbi:MAG: three-Cys-motif partner protein TcmP [Saprospiraceae bacterium]
MADHLHILQEPPSDKWGSFWTLDKIEIFEKYLKAYLAIMSKKRFELIYFDGFAGSGSIDTNIGYDSLIEGIATRTLGIDNPISFDIYYLVEKDEKKAERLKTNIQQKFPNKKVHIVATDCNEKLISLADYLGKRKDHRRALAILDPYGMALNWSSLIPFKNLGCDMWILVPTGIAVNRLLPQSGEIDESWMLKLTRFLGLSDEEILKEFYSKQKTYTLFGEEEKITKIRLASN